MNQRIKDKIGQYKKVAGNGKHTPSPGNDAKHRESDGLAKVIRKKRTPINSQLTLTG